MTPPQAQQVSLERPRADAAARGDAESAAGPFVINLCSSTTPMALSQPRDAALARFKFFMSRRLEDGRERFRLHMGYFETLADAEELLGVVREIYPGAWAGEAPGKRLRARNAAPEPEPAAGPAAARSAPPAASPATPVASPAPPQAPPAQVLPLVPPADMPVPHDVPVLHAASSSAAEVPATKASAAPAAKAAPVRPSAAKSVVTKPSGTQPAVARASATAAPAAQPAAARAASGRAPVAAAAVAPAATKAPAASLQLSNVREVLAALDESHATREMPALAAARTPSAPARASDPEPNLSDTQVLRLLESRGAEEGRTPDDGSISLLKPDDTGTRRALKDAVATNAPVSFAVQLQWSVKPIDAAKVPPLAIFSAYTLYTVEGSREGRRWYGLRLGFFSDAISAKQVAHYVRSEFNSVAVVPVSPQERSRATDGGAAPAAPKPARAKSPLRDRLPEPTAEFKLFDDEPEPRVPQPKPPAVDSQPATAAPSRRAAKGSAGRVRAREKRSPQTLEETLEILGADELEIDRGSGDTLNDTGVRHLAVQVRKSSPFTKLLDRLAERARGK